MDALRLPLRFMKILRDCRGIAALAAVGMLSAAARLSSWYERNGAVLFGRCANHFGEEYDCSLARWLSGDLVSPFAWPAMLLGFTFIWAVLSTMFWAAARMFPQLREIPGAPYWARMTSRCLTVLVFGAVFVVWGVGFVGMWLAR